MNQTALTTREQAVTSSAALVEASVYKGQEMNTAAKKAERERRVFQKGLMHERPVRLNVVYKTGTSA
jgi:hypothetical protein